MLGNKDKETVSESHPHAITEKLDRATLGKFIMFIGNVTRTGQRHPRHSTYKQTSSDTDKQLTSSDTDKQLTSSDTDKQLTSSDTDKQLTILETSRWLIDVSGFTKDISLPKKQDQRYLYLVK